MLLANSGNGYGGRNILERNRASCRGPLQTDAAEPRHVCRDEPTALIARHLPVPNNMAVVAAIAALRAEPGILPHIPQGHTMPISKALSTARVRSRTPSLDRMLETWFLTVPSATVSELAISLLL